MNQTLLREELTVKELKEYCSKFPKCIGCAFFDADLNIPTVCSLDRHGYDIWDVAEITKKVRGE